MKSSKIMAVILTLTMIFSVLASFPMTASAATMADSTFFAKLNYAAYPGLSAVKAAVDKNDYETAKKELLAYYKARKASGFDLGFSITEDDENYGMAVLPMRNILTGPYEFDVWQTEFTVTSSEFQTYEVDVTDRVASELSNGAVSFMLFAGDKQQYPVIVQSKEAGSDVAPKLTIRYNDGSDSDKEITVTADNDTYISSQNTSSTYGRESKLYIKEDGTGSNSTGTNTRRTYINFPLSDAANSTILSAVLKVSAAYADDCTTGDKDVLVINIGDTIWTENSLTWAGTRGNIYSYQNAQNPTWNASAPNADSEYHNVTARFWFGRPMAYEYLSYLDDPEAYNESHPFSDKYPGEEFGPKLVELMNAFATQMNYGWDRTLETGERLNRWVDIVDAFLATDVFDDHVDEFVNILSFMWGDCNYLNGLSISNGSVWWSNWRIVANAGFFKAVEFLPEFNTHDSFRSKVEYNVEYTMDLLNNDDMSFAEAGPAYAQWCVQLFGDCAIAAENAGNPMSSAFITRLRYATRSALASFFPDGYDSNVGDSNYRDQMRHFKRLADLLNDPVIDAYVNGDGSYDENLVSFYDCVNSAYMRTSWDPDETTYVSFVNNPNDGHYHPDSNQVLMYAYGQPLLVDSGRYSYSSTNKIYDELRYASAHNTIESEGLTLAAHSSSAEKFSVWADNDMFSFGTTTQHGYPSTKHTRNVLFLKNANGATLVTDYVDGSKAKQTYRQNWHFMPSNNATVDGHTISTNFYEKANVDLYNADSTAESEILPGYFSADYGLVANSQYASFKKTGTDVKFSTFIMPRKAGAETANLTVTDTVSNIHSSAVSVTDESTGENVMFYIKNTDSANGSFGDYTTDAKMAFGAENLYGLANGSTLYKDDQEIISSPIELNSIGVEKKYDSDSSITYEITAEGLTPRTTGNNLVKLYAPDAEKVIFEGNEIEFVKDGDYIYAVGIASVTTSEIVASIEADKDGFVASSYGNEGTTYPGIIQASSDWQNRNAYIGFDLSDYADTEFNKATIRLYPTELANSPGALYFYWLDYGTWTRDNLNFILDSDKMPTHTSYTGTYTGYSGSFSGSSSGLSVGSPFDVDFTDELKERIASNEDLKFTFAVLSSGGSVKFASINNSSYPGPTIILSNETTEGVSEETVVTVNFVDDEGNELLDPLTITKGLNVGNIYTYDDAPEFIEANGATYTLDQKNSSLGTMIEKGVNNQLTAVYTPAAEIEINFLSDGEQVFDSETEYVVPGTTFTYTPNIMYFLNGQAYLTDSDNSTLSVKAQKDEKNIIEVILSKTTISGNLITNGDFTNGTTDWTDAASGGKFGGTVSDEYAHGDGNSLTNTSGSGGSTATTLRRFIPVEEGKTYYLSYYAYNTGSALSSGNNGFMSAYVPVKGTAFGTFDGVTFKDYVEYGGQNSWSNESQSEVKRDRSDMPYDTGMNHKEFIFNIPDGTDNIMISMFAWTDPGRLYFSDFELYELSSDNDSSVNVTVRYVNEAGEEILSSKSFKAELGSSYDASNYVITDPIYGNKKIRTYNAEATKGLTGIVTENTVIDVVYSEEDYDGILLYLSFDDEETGFAGGVGKAIAQGEITLTDGVEGKALSLDGTGSNWLNAVTSENDASLLANIEEMTVSYYCKINSTENANWPFYAAPNEGTQTYGNEHYLGALDSDKSIKIERYSNSGSRNTENNITVDAPEGEWRLVTVVVKKDKTELYINGVPAGEQTASNTLEDILGSSPIFQIGKANWNDGEFCDGLIDKFTVYDWALTDKEVAELTNPDKPTLSIDGDVVTVNADADSTLIIAQYDKDRRLLKVETKDIKAGEEAVFTITRVDDAVEAAAFLWGSLLKMNPITSAVISGYEQ